MSPCGLKATRNHPPVAGVDAPNHDTMHPGLWLAFGDISGTGCWRNKGRIQHVRFGAVIHTGDHYAAPAACCGLFTSAVPA